jgi:mono/diheme cytochrome c family protein
MPCVRSSACLGPGAFFALAVAALPSPGLALDYERDIMPIFETKCFDCHSAEAETMKGGLKLDDPKHLLGRFDKNSVVVPGDWDASYLFVVITRAPDHKEAMPPKDKGEALTPEEILKVANWIHEGARVDGERGERGEKENNPDAVLKFKDGRMVTEEFAPSEGPATTREEIVRDWINRDGKKIRAIFKGLESGNALLELENGKLFRYPLEKLSDGSRLKVRELSGESKE